MDDASYQYLKGNIRRALRFYVVNASPITQDQAQELARIVWEHEASHWRDDDHPQAELTYGNRTLD